MKADSLGMAHLAESIYLLSKGESDDKLTKPAHEVVGVIFRDRPRYNFGKPLGQDDV